jgi:triphosphoribosyl-dephospho-CoA synthetase
VWTAELGPYTEGFIDVVELPRDSVLGYRVIGGGTDSQFVLFETHTETAASSLFVRAFAEEAAAYVVANDFDRPATERKLLRSVEEDTRDEARVREQLALLVGELHSKLVSPDSEAVSELLEVFRASLEDGDAPTRAWQTVLTAMLQDVTITYL